MTTQQSPGARTPDAAGGQLGISVAEWQSCQHAAKLVELLKQPGVMRPEATHTHDCPRGRMAGRRGVCKCGGRDRDARLRLALEHCGVSVAESPAQMHERESLKTSGRLCEAAISRSKGRWICAVCGWRYAPKA